MRGFVYTLKEKVSPFPFSYAFLWYDTYREIS